MSITIAANPAVIRAENSADGTGIAGFVGVIPFQRDCVCGPSCSEARDEKRKLYREKSDESETYWAALFKDFIFGKKFLLLAITAHRVHGTAEDRRF